MLLMHAYCLRRLVLACALAVAAAAQAQESGFKPGGGRPHAARAGQAAEPVFIEADRIEGIADREASAEGNAVLRKGQTSIRAQRLHYIDATEEVDARGEVRLERDGDVITGPSLKYRIGEASGEFERPEFSVAPRARPDRLPVTGRGKAERAVFEGEDRIRLFDTFFATCSPGNDDWYLQVGELELDYAREEGVARRARVVFKGIPIMLAPYLDFALNNRRKSGLLAPSVGSTGKSGMEVTVPYYFNIAPNRDLVLSPRYLQKRGLQLGGQFRYLEPNYYGDARLEVLPDDQARNLSRSAVALVHNYSDPSRRLSGALNLNRASDDNYFRDLSSRTIVVAQTHLLREGFLTYHGNWWQGGAWNATARFQGFQTLQDAARSIAVPYGRAPQLTLNATRLDAFGTDFNLAGELVDFHHPTNTLGRRTTLYPSLALPIVRAGGFLTPRLGLHATHYNLDRIAPGTPEVVTRTLPILSVDGGFFFERETSWRGQALLQTLEPRAFYVAIPFRDQSRIPLFDTAVADFNYAQIFSENAFAGGDRINDAHQLTLALTSRLLVAASGQEAFKATLGQRYYFQDQRVTLAGWRRIGPWRTPCSTTPANRAGSALRSARASSPSR
ncbi:MAG: LPS-assembly protein LptD [Betaproteobacteria bacterium]|nr:LPS-assembly protein LptD [Betaproteobacteria bacterium]